MLEFGKQRLVCQTTEHVYVAQLFLFNFPIWVAPLAELKFILNYDQSVQLDVSVDRMPALVDQRTDDQTLRIEMLKQLAGHLPWQVIEAGWFNWWAHFGSDDASV